MRDIAATILLLGKELDVDERAVVAHKLLATLHEEGDDQTQVEAAWRVELRRRIDDVEHGRVAPLSHEDTVALARDIATGLQ